MEQTYTLNDYARLCHKANESWWPADKLSRPKGQLLALCVSELSEALEGHRRDLRDDKLPHRRMVEVELVDFLIRAFDMAGGYGWDIQEEEIGLPSLAAYGQYYYNQNRYAVSDNFPDNEMRVIAHLINCWVGYDEAASLQKAICSVLTVMSHYQMDIQGAFDEKMAFNAHRADHKLEHRAADGGKKY